MRYILQFILTIFLVKMGSASEIDKYSYRLASKANKNNFLDIKYEDPESGPLLTVHRGKSFFKVGQ